MGSCPDCILEGLEDLDVLPDLGLEWMESLLDIFCGLLLDHHLVHDGDLILLVLYFLSDYSNSTTIYCIVSTLQATQSLLELGGT